MSGTLRRYCSPCLIWWSHLDRKHCPRCGEEGCLVPADRAVKDWVDPEVSAEALALAAQVEYLETQRCYLLGQAHAIDEWLRHLRAGDAESPPESFDCADSEDAQLLAKARRYGLDTFALKG